MRVRAVAYVAVAGLVLAGCGGQKSAQQGPPPLAVDVARAQQRDIATDIRLDGQIAPLQQSTVSSPESANVTEVLVNEGDRVHRGDLLAKLDTSQLEAQLAANEATVNESEAKLRGSAVQAPISSQQYISAVTAAQQSLQQAQNRVATDVPALANAKLVYDGDVQLAQEGYVAATALEQAHATYVAAEQELHNARQALAPAEAALRSAQKNTQLTLVDQATIAQNRAALSEAEAQVQLLRTEIAQSSVYAPFDGVVTARLVDPGAFEAGSFGGSSSGIVTVSQLDHVYVNANVPDEDLAFVRRGTPVTFTSQSLPGRVFSGSVFDVNPVPSTGTLSYRARLLQPNPDLTLRGGMLVSVIVPRERHPNATVVPRTAIFQGDQGTSVYTVVDGKAKMLPVQVGLETDTLAEVHGAGVRPGTVVITTRPDALQDGSVVAISGSTPAAAH
jgi:RND family efflux transporter MFP subunit